MQFSYLLRTVPENGNIVINADDQALQDVLAKGCWTPCIFFAKLGHATAEWQWQSLAKDGSVFALYHNGEKVMECNWQMIGEHNVANACAVAAAASSMGVGIEHIARAFESFGGIRRRMSLVGEARGIRIFDDFAHHPTAIDGVVSAAKHAMRGKGRLWVIVEPRSNTMRTHIHQERLPQCFADADKVIFAPPSTRNLGADELLDVAWVCENIGDHAQVIADVEHIVEEIAAHAVAGDDVLILSNGGFDGIHQKMLARLEAL